jgi:hypothetical protein
MQQAVRNNADQLLRDIGKVTARIAASEVEAEKEIEVVRAHYARGIDPLRDRLKGLDKELITLMKSRRVPLFDGKDTLKLLHGILLYNKEDKVSIPRDALEKIKAQKWKEAILVAESVNRAVVEKWPDERLVVIGAKRKAKETYSYELTNKSEVGGQKSEVREQKSEIKAR